MADFIADCDVTLWSAVLTRDGSGRLILLLIATLSVPHSAALLGISVRSSLKLHIHHGHIKSRL